MSLALLVGLGGFLGTLARYGINGLLATVSNPFPWQTFIVNTLGCFLMACLSYLFEAKNYLSLEIRLLLTTGFCGGFTTFSSYIFEVIRLGKQNELPLAFTYLLLSLVSGLGAYFLGDFICKKLF